MRKNQGLNGIWGWIKRHVHAIAGVCTAIGLAPIGLALEAITASTSDSGSGGGGDMGDNTMGKSGGYEPTTAEASILDPWVEYKLTPFYKNLLIQIKSAFDSTSHDFQLQTINEVIMKMCVVRSYYAKYETNGLSSSAISLRSELIDNIFRPIDDMIDNSIVNDTNVHIENYSVVINPTQFLPLNIQATSFNCEKYVNSNPTTQNTQNSPPLLTSSPVVINPVTNQVIPVQNSVTTNSNPTNSNPTNSRTAIVLLSILGLVIMFYPDKKKKK